MKDLAWYLNPVETLSFEIADDVNEAVRRLQTVTRKRAFLRYSRFKGQINGTRFKVTLGNAFDSGANPTVSGELVQCANGTRVQADLSFGKYERRFLVIWVLLISSILFLPFVTAIAAIFQGGLQGFLNYFDQRDMVGTIISIIFLLTFWSFMVSMPFWLMKFGWDMTKDIFLATFGVDQTNLEN